MCLLTEAIKIEKRKLCNIEYHQARFDKARAELLGVNDKLKLEDSIQIPDEISDDTHKCKIVYSNKIHSIEFTLYDKKLPRSIKLVCDDATEYSYKYENREALKKLVSNSGADEIVIVKDGLITDTSRSNIVLSKNNEFVTPASFLLEGTMRKNMLCNKLITEEEITIDKLFMYDKLFLINAMLDLSNQPGFPVSEIKR